MPLQLERVLSSNGLVAAGFGASSIRSNSLSSHPQSRVQHSWVRRRRWVRIMRRRLDIPPLAFLEPDGAMYHLDFDGTLIPYIEENNSNVPDEDEGREMGAMSSTFLSSAQDYVARARYLVGNQLQDNDVAGSSMSAVDVRRAIVKVERATMELRQGMLGTCCIRPRSQFIFISFISVGDEDAERKIQAEVLLNTYSRDLERRRLAAGAQGLLISDHGMALSSAVHTSLMGSRR